MGRRKGFGKIKKPKVAPFELIDHNLKPLPEPYKLMAEVRSENWGVSERKTKISIGMRKTFSKYEGEGCSTRRNGQNQRRSAQMDGAEAGRSR